MCFVRRNTENVSNLIYSLKYLFLKNGNGLKCALVWCLVGETVDVQFKFHIFSPYLHHLLERLTLFFFLLKLPLCEASRKQFERDCVTDSKFQLQDCSHSLVSAKPGDVIRNLPFWYCAINCAGGEVIKLPPGIGPSFICTGSDLNIWPGGSAGSLAAFSI